MWRLTLLHTSNISFLSITQPTEWVQAWLLVLLSNTLKLIKYFQLLILMIVFNIFHFFCHFLSPSLSLSVLISLFVFWMCRVWILYGECDFTSAVFVCRRNLRIHRGHRNSSKSYISFCNIWLYRSFIRSLLRCTSHSFIHSFIMESKVSQCFFQRFSN